MPFVGGPHTHYKFKMADGRHLGKIVISQPRFDRFWRNVATDFDEIWRDDAVRPSWQSRSLKIWNFKNPRWRRPPSWNIEKSPYLSCGLTDFDEIWHSDGVRPPCTLPTIKILKIQDKGDAILRNRKLTYLRRGVSEFDKIWHSDTVRISWPFRSLKM